MVNTWKRGLAAWVLQLALPVFLLACYQAPGLPTRISNDHLKVKFTYNGKPLTGAVVMLSNRKAKASPQAIVDTDGWVTFPKVKPGNYHLVFDGPSHETFEIVLEPPSGNATSMYVYFYADYCRNILVRREPKDPEF